MSGFNPTYRADSIHLYIGTWCTGRATADSTTLDECAFTRLPGATEPVSFSPADVGCPIAIVGAGPIDPLTPVTAGIQGSTFHTTIAVYVSPTEVTLTDAPPTSFQNSGVNNIAVYRECLMVMDSFQYTPNIAPGTSDSLEFVTLDDPTHGYDYLTRNQVICAGQPIFVTSDDPDVGDIFGGLIDVLAVSNQMSTSGSGPSASSTSLSSPTNAAGPTPFSFSAQCSSWDSIAARRIVQPEAATSYANIDAAVCMNTVVVSQLTNEGIAFENDIPVVSESPYVSGLPAIDFNCAAGTHISDLLNQLVSQINASDPTKLYFWYTDEWKVIHLSERTVSDAPWDVDDTAGSAGNVLLSVAVVNSHNQLANDCYVIASEYLQNVTTVTFAGNGTATTFNLPSPAVVAPTITLNGNPQTVGILNIDVGMDWYWAQSSSVITQDAGGTVLGAADALAVAYQLSSPGVGVAFNNQGLTDREAVEGTGCLYQSSTTFATPINQDGLLAIAESLAAEYGTIPQQINAMTLRPGLQVGQFQTINLADIGVSGQFLISALTLTSTNNILTWSYTAIGGSNIGNQITAWAKFINKGSTGIQITTPVPQITAADNTITIDHTKVTGGADIPNFIFCFTGAYNFLKQKPGGGVAYPNGSDIFFSSDPQGTDVLAFDLAFYNVSGQITAWILIPTLSHTVDTVIYLQYGNGAISTSLANPPAVWSPAADVSGTPNANYHGVYHLTEEAAPFEDSTKYGNDSTGTSNAYPNFTDSPFGLGQFFNQAAGGNSINLPALLTGNGFDNFSGTLECWFYSIKQQSGVIYYDLIICAQTTGGPQYGPGLATSGAGFSAPGYGTGMLTNDGSYSTVTDTSIVINDGAWHKLVFTMDGTDGKLYVDGVYGGDLGYGQNVPMTGITYLCNTIRPGNYTGAECALTEVFVSQIAKTAALIATEYANQGSPNTFFNVTRTVVAPNAPPVNVVGNPSGTVTNSAGPLTSGEPIFGNGGADILAGTKQGSTTQAQMASGAAGAAGDPLVYDAGGNAVAGAAGQLVPAGGTSGEVLTKNSSTDYDISWEAGGGTDDIEINGATTLNTIQVNATQVWQGQTEIQFNGSFI